MSAPGTLPDESTRLETAPDFELSFAVDDEDDPSEVTVFPEDGSTPTTTWITIDVEHAVDLEDVL